MLPPTASVTDSVHEGLNDYSVKCTLIVPPSTGSESRTIVEVCFGLQSLRFVSMVDSTFERIACDLALTFG